jgi:hypothetical protein
VSIAAQTLIQCIAVTIESAQYLENEKAQGDE